MSGFNRSFESAFWNANRAAVASAQAKQMAEIRALSGAEDAATADATNAASQPIGTPGRISAPASTRSSLFPGAGDVINPAVARLIMQGMQRTSQPHKAESVQPGSPSFGSLERAYVGPQPMQPYGGFGPYRQPITIQRTFG